MKMIRQIATSTTAFVMMSSACFAASTLEETRKVEGFDRVHLAGSMDVEIKVGPEQSVRVVADDDVLEYLKTVVDGDTLKIYLDDDHSGFIDTMDVFVTVPVLEGVGVHGSGDIRVEDAVSDKFDIDVHGSGDVKALNTKTQLLSIDVHGSGDVRVDGTCSGIEVEIHGSGDVAAAKMKCQEAKVSVHGSGDVAVYADKEASARVNGSGDVSIAGKPAKINTRVHGSGDIYVR